MPIPLLEQWKSDPEFQALPGTEKKSVFENYFDQELADNDFFSLPASEQKSIKDNFLSDHGITPKPSLTWERAGGALKEGVKDVARTTAQAISGIAQTGIPEAAQVGLESIFPAAGVLRLIPKPSKEETSGAFKEVAESKGLQPSPEYQGESSGWVEDFVRSAPQMGSQIIATLAGGPLAGMGLMGLQITGGTYEDAIKKGAQPDKALAWGMANAIVQAPLEQIGVSKISKLWQPQKSLIAKLKEIGEAAGTEWLTEFIQQFPDSFTNIFATNPDKATVENLNTFADQFWQNVKEGAYQGTLTAPWALLGAGGGIKKPNVPRETPSVPTQDPQAVLQQIETLWGQKQIGPEHIEVLKKRYPDLADDIEDIKNRSIIDRVDAGEDPEQVIRETTSQAELAAAQQPEEEPIDLGQPWTRSMGEVEDVEGAKYVSARKRPVEQRVTENVEVPATEIEDMRSQIALLKEQLQGKRGRWVDERGGLMEETGPTREMPKVEPSVEVEPTETPQMGVKKEGIPQIANEYGMPLVVVEEVKGKPILAWRGSDLTIPGSEGRPSRPGAKLHVFPNAKNPTVYPPSQAINENIRLATKEDIANISPEVIKDYPALTAEPAPTAPPPKPETKQVEEGKGKPPDLLPAITSLQRPGQPRELVSTEKLRAKFPDLSKEEFDKAVFDLAKQDKVALHHHDFPSSLTPEKREKMPKDDRGKYVVGVVPVEKRGEKADEVIPFKERPPEEKKIIEGYNKKMDSKEWVEAYEDDADMQHFTKEEGHSPLADELIRDLERDGLKKGANILEIGSGQGRDGTYLAGKGHNVRGIDVSDKAVAIANERSKGKSASFEVGDAENLYQFEAESQDAVYSIAALHGTSIKFTFQEIFRVLKPGGQAKLFLYTRTKTGNKWVSYWTPKEIRQYAEETGFKVEKFREGHDTEPIEVPDVPGKVDQETHLVVTTFRKPKNQGEAAGPAPDLAPKAKKAPREEAKAKTETALKEKTEQPFSYEGSGYKVTQVKSGLKDAQTKWKLDIDEKHKTALDYLAGQVETGEPGKRLKTTSYTGGEEWKALRSSYPDFMKDEGWTKDEVISAIDKAVKGESLGIRQAQIVEKALAVADELVYSSYRKGLKDEGISPTEIAKAEGEADQDFANKMERDFQEAERKALNGETAPEVTKEVFDFFDEIKREPVTSKEVLSKAQELQGKIRDLQSEAFNAAKAKGEPWSEEFKTAYEQEIKRREKQIKVYEREIKEATGEEKAAFTPEEPPTQDLFAAKPVEQKPEEVKAKIEHIALDAEDYRGMHTAPDKESGSPGHDLRGTYPDDIYGYQAAQYYGHYGQNHPMDLESIGIMQRMKFHPDKLVTVYRAVPKDVKTKINPGDWVTINRAYAKEHGQSQLGKYKILQKLVHARDIFTDGNSIHEWGYDPQPFVPNRERPEEYQPKHYREFKAKMKEKGIILKAEPRPPLTRTLSFEDLNRHVDRIVKNWKAGPLVNAVEDYSNIPEEIRDVAEERFAKADLKGLKALFVRYPDGKAVVYLIRNRLSSTQEAEISIIHEVFGHYGISIALDDKELNQFYKRMYFAKTKQIKTMVEEFPAYKWDPKKKTGFNLDTPEGRAKAADEWFARAVAERGIEQDPWLKRQWDKFVQIVNDALRAVGFQVKLSDAEIRQVLRASVKAVTEGPAKGLTVSSTSAMFGGVEAKGAPLGALDRAQQMSNFGSSDETIRKETGWHKGPEGKWRFEIDDSGAKITSLSEWESLRIEFDKPLTLPMVLNHDVLFKHYPFLEKTTVSDRSLGVGGRGEYRDGVIWIDSGLTDSEVKETLFHEIQHAIQNHEKFSRGGSDILMGSSLIAEMRDANPEIKRLDDEINRLWGKYKTYDNSKIQKLMDQRGELTSQYIQSKYGMTEEEADDYGYTLYHRLAGEIEARETSARRELTAKERREKAPTFEDIPRDQWIVRDGEGTSFSVEPPEGRGKLEPMTKKPGKADITTQKPQAEGGKTIFELKKEDLAIQDELKKWLYNNVEHWTWVDSREENWLKPFRRKDIPFDKLTELDVIGERLSNVRKARDERLVAFVSKREISDFTRSELNETISYSDMEKATGWDKIKDIENPIGPERIYFRYGDLPKGGKSYNSMTNSYEKGVSVYVTPRVGSLAGYGGKKIYYGKGRQIGIGGDEEPVIIPSGKWKVFDIEEISPNLTGPREGGPEAAASFASETKLEFLREDDGEKMYRAVSGPFKGGIFTEEMARDEGFEIPGEKKPTAKLNLKPGDVVSFRAPDGHIVNGKVRDIDQNAKQVWVFHREKELYDSPEAASTKVPFDRVVTEIADISASIESPEERIDRLFGKAPAETKAEVKFDEEHQEDTLKAFETFRDFLKANKRGWKPQKEDTHWLDRLYSVPLHHFRKVPALGRLFGDGVNRTDNYYSLLNSLTQGPDQKYHTATIEAFRKDQKEEFKKFQKYLVERDRNQIGFEVKQNKEDQYEIYLGKTKYGDTYATEEQAWNQAITLEVAKYKTSGASDQAADALNAFRRVTHNGFRILMKNMRDIIDRFETAGIPLPEVAIKVEGGKSVKVDLKMALAKMGDMRGYYFPRIRRPGQYMLSAKKEDSKILEFFDTKAFLTKRQMELERQGYTVTKDLSPKLPEDVFQMAGEVIAMQATINSALERIHSQGLSLEDFGLEFVDRTVKGGTRDFVVRGPSSKRMNEVFKDFGGKWYAAFAGEERMWHFINPGRDFQKRLSKALAAQVGIIDQQTDLLFAKTLAEQVADVIKARGHRAHMIERSDAKGADVWTGYEEDPALAVAQYARGIAAGEAKKNMALDMVRHFTGTDISWREYKADKEDAGEEPDYEEYMKMVEERRISPTKQPNAFKEGKVFMEDMLRNQEHIDRVMGTIKGIAVLKYLAGRVSAPVVNLTALATSAPGAISGYAKVSIPTALANIGKAGKLYAQHLLAKKGKGLISKEMKDLFDEIESKGWHKAQYNREALSVLESRVGRQWNNLIEWSMAMFGASEQLNRVSTIAGAYLALKGNAKPGEFVHEQALEKAKDISDKAHGVYGKANRPHWARGGGIAGQVAASFYVFKTFSHNYLLTMKDLGLNEKQAGAALYMAASPMILAGTGALVGKQLITAIAQALGIGGDDPEETLYQWVYDNAGPKAENLVRHGVFGVPGVNLKGSLEIGITDIPTTITEVLGAPASIFQDLYRGGGSILRGDVMKGAEKMLPNALGAPIRAVREATEGVTTTSNAPVFYGKEPLVSDTTEAIYRFLSFNPSRIAGIREKQWKEKEIETKYTNLRKDIYAKAKRFYLNPSSDRSEAEWINILTEIKGYNERVIANGLHRKGIPVINGQSLRENIQRGFKPNKKERMRVLETEEE